jgi:outer membrane protein OmpA-like peptidoglycan-associated protein
MSRSTRSEKNRPKKSQPDNSHIAQRAAEKAAAVPEALQRAKDNNYPQVKQGDLLALQGMVGNKAVRNLMSQRLAPGPSPLQRHSIPDGRRGVGEEDDVIRRYSEPGIQRHSIPDGRRGVGEEDDVIRRSVIQRRAIQRAPAFGRPPAPAGARPPSGGNLWGNGLAATVQRRKGDVASKIASFEGKIAEAAKGKEAASAPVDKAAEADYKKYIGGGPYRIDPYVPDTVDDFGKFESIYDPANRTLTADMRVKFLFPDLPLPTGSSPTAKIQAPLIKAIHKAYIANFIGQVHKGWSGRFNFKNVRDPQSVWGKLNPIQVKVNVRPVTTNQHYILKGYFNKTGTANVRSNSAAVDPATVSLFKGDLDPSTQSFTNSPDTGKHEITRLERNLPKLRFANSSTLIESKYEPDLQYVSDYLKRMNRPKFNIEIIGRASKTGPEPANIKFSKLRAQKTHDRLVALGVTNHQLKVSGVGSAGATAHESWRRVDFKIEVDKSFSNVQDTTLHEFGHMLGLDDEYVRKKDTRTHTTQKVWMQKMLGNEAYGKGQENKYADEVTKVDPLSSASVMESGNEVRPYHYVTLWQALYDTAAKGGNQPMPAFTWKDWKVVG